MANTSQTTAQTSKEYTSSNRQTASQTTAEYPSAFSDRTRLLDIYSGAKFAYSLRYLSSDYTEPVVTVRRDSDGGTGHDQEEHFFPSDISSGALARWVGPGNDGFVTTWYDQSGNGENLVNAEKTTQPFIVAGGGLVSGGLVFENAHELETTNTFSFGDGSVLSTFVTNSFDTTPDINGYVFRFSNYIYFILGNGTRRVSAGSAKSFPDASIETVTDDVEELATIISSLNSDGTGRTRLYANSVIRASNQNIGTGVIANRNLNIGGVSSNNYLSGSINELIIYDSDQNANRAAIEADIISNVL